MEIVGKYGKDEVAILYIAKIEDRIVEFVESVQPLVPRDSKWVLILSTLYGCPMQCLMCDAGEYYHGKVSKDAMLAQLDYMIRKRYPTGEIPSEKFKIQFARMGEPSLNTDVLEVLRALPTRYNAPGLLPCMSSIAPVGTESFFEELLTIKNEVYPPGQFQLQFSIHSTDEAERQRWLPKPIWSFEKISAFGDTWSRPGDRKITLNFAVGEESIIDPHVIATYFSKDKYFIKLTPVNPTRKAVQNKLTSGIRKDNSEDLPLAHQFRSLGYDTLVSIGNWEEDKIGSNCGMFATEYIKGNVKLKEHYTSNDYSLPLE